MLHMSFRIKGIAKWAHGPKYTNTQPNQSESNLIDYQSFYRGFHSNIWHNLFEICSKFITLWIEILFSPITVSLITSPMFLMCKVLNLKKKSFHIFYIMLRALKRTLIAISLYVYIFLSLKFECNFQSIYSLPLFLFTYTQLHTNLGSVKSISIPKLNVLLPMAHFVFVFTKKKKHNKICKTFTYSYVSMCCLLLLRRNVKKISKMNTISNKWKNMDEFVSVKVTINEQP